MQLFKIFSATLILSSLTVFSVSIMQDEESISDSSDCLYTAMQDTMGLEECCYEEHPNRIQIGANYTYAWIRPTGNPTTKGSLYGAQGIYEYRPINDFYGAVAFDWRQGNTKGGGSRRYIHNFDAQERVGFTVVKGARRLALFVGLGGRYMSEKVMSGNASVKFRYVHLYVPVGLLHDHDINQWLNWGVNIQWRPQIYSTVQIVPLNGARWMLNRRIDNFLLEMPITFKLPKRFSLILNPYFEAWHDGHSSAETTNGLTLGLPGNRYYFTGCDLNIGWEF